MRFFVIIIILSVTTPSSAQTHYTTQDNSKAVQVVDPWFGFDKVQHFTFSFLWTLSSQYIIENKMEIDDNNVIFLSSGSAFSAGLLKEFYDQRKPQGYFSKRDLVANSLGVMCAVAVIMM
ncbi:MAG: DUF2279 domain-containing protein [Candidatus Marinimicrobia bacterium]|nr:DUF2279 domain-containing protein [Candidatus Neomarinimicrobiota bacterium]